MSKKLWIFLAFFCGIASFPVLFVLGALLGDLMGSLLLIKPHIATSEDILIGVTALISFGGSFFLFSLLAGKGNAKSAAYYTFSGILFLVAVVYAIFCFIAHSYNLLWFSVTGGIITFILLKTFIKKDDSQNDPEQNDLAQSEQLNNQDKPAKGYRYCQVCGAAIDQETFTCTGCGKQYHKIKVSLKKFAKNFFTLRRLNIFLIICLICLSGFCVYQHTKIEETQAVVAEISTLLADVTKTRDTLKNNLVSLMEDTNELRWEYEQQTYEYDFFHDYACIVIEGNSYYHHYDHYDTYEFHSRISGNPIYFLIYNIETAESRGYKPCPDCWYE